MTELQNNQRHLLEINQQARSSKEETGLFNNDDCTICQEKYSNDYYILPCYHKFDIECLIELKKRLCPLCRIVIREYKEIERRYLLTHKSLPKITSSMSDNLYIGNHSYFPF